MLVLSLALSLLVSDAAPSPNRDHAPLQAASQTSAVLSGVRVQLDCAVSAEGLVSGCRVLRETHPGLGFGDAAVALMTGATINPVVAEGRPVQARVERTIEFMP